MAEGEKIIPINIENEMRTAYIDYSMSVIVSRALPDVRDGLKPVHRRVLFGMQELGMSSGRPYKKSARLVGEVLGKYHPHGDGSVYDAMVRMAQDWSLRYPLVDGQGNFGSIDADPPAAMRYTEARMRRIAEEVLGDLDKETVDMRPNFDDTLEEPSVMPTRIPQAARERRGRHRRGHGHQHGPAQPQRGRATPSWRYIDNQDIDVAGLMQYIKGPDFPTGGVIQGIDGHPRGLRDRSRPHRAACQVPYRGRSARPAARRIICTEIPYQTNKAVQLVQGRGRPGEREEDRGYQRRQRLQRSQRHPPRL